MTTLDKIEAAIATLTYAKVWAKRDRFYESYAGAAAVRAMAALLEGDPVMEQWLEDFALSIESDADGERPRDETGALIAPQAVWGVR